MRIGINLLYLIPGKVGGTETYARHLIPELAKHAQLVIFCGRETAPTFAPSDNIEIVTLPISSTNRSTRILAEQTLLPYLCAKHQVDVIFSLGYSAPLFHSVPSVVTIHDLNWYYHPEDFSQVSRVIWRWLTILSAKYSDHIITDSSASASSIVEVIHLPRAKVTPILHATPTPLVAKPNTKYRPYILTVLAGYPHKNLSTLLRAFAQLSKQYGDLTLVVCGLGGNADVSNQELIHSLGLSKQVKIMGYVSRQELASLYKGAEVFVFPSAYEGFGYPVLEAMSYNTPVVSSRAYSLSEVVGEAGILIDPYDVSALARAIESILVSPSLSQQLIKRGKKRVGELQWDTTARATLSVLQGATAR